MRFRHRVGLRQVQVFIGLGRASRMYDFIDRSACSPYPIEILREGGLSKVTIALQQPNFNIKVPSADYYIKYITLIMKLAGLDRGRCQFGSICRFVVGCSLTFVMSKSSLPYKLKPKVIDERVGDGVQHSFPICSY